MVIVLLAKSPSCAPAGVTAADAIAKAAATIFTFLAISPPGVIISPLLCIVADRAIRENIKFQRHSACPSGQAGLLRRGRFAAQVVQPSMGAYNPAARKRSMFGKLNHLAITTDHYTTLGMFYRAVFGMKVSGDTSREMSA